MRKTKGLSMVMAIVMLLGMIMGGQTVSAMVPPTSDFTFDGATGTITGYIGTGGAVEIPSTIGGTTVLAIGADAFRDKSAITGISIPDSVTSIGERAFYNCSLLKSISIPIHATTVAAYTFQYCTELENITIPEGVKAIEELAFFDCINNESIVIPSTVTSIGDHAFSKEQNLYSQKLSQAYFTGDAPVIGTGIFKIVDTDFKVYYPNNKTGYTEEWSKTAAATTASGCTFPNGITLVPYDPTAEYSVTFDGNGSTSGTVPSDTSKYKTTKAVTVSANTLTKANYKFTRWNTKADGTGTSYDPGDKFVMGIENVVLYAQWLPTYYTISKGTITHGSISIKMNDAEIDKVDETAFGKDGGPELTVTLIPEAGYRYKSGTLKYSYGSSEHYINEEYAPNQYVLTMPKSNVTVYAEFEAKPSSSGNSDTSSGNSNTTTSTTPPPAPTPAPVITVTPRTGNGAPSVTGIANGAGKDDGKGNVTAALTTSQVTDALNTALAEAAKKGGNTEARVGIKVTAPTGAKSVEAGIQKAAVDAVAGSKAVAMSVSTPLAALTFDGNSLDTISKAAGDVKISVSKVDIATLSAEAKNTVGDRPVFNFNVTSGNQTISQFGGTVSVSIPYTPKAGEDLNAIVIYYINAEGKLEAVGDCVYDAATGTIRFQTSHFSTYAVGYNKVSFKDVAANAWYAKAVGFVAARDITEGTGNSNFSPEAKLTRGQLLVMLMKAYGISPDKAPKDNFADAGNTYYTGYLAAAKRLGISNGVGNNRFAPEKDITQQEMYTLTYNTLKSIGQLPANSSGKTLKDFTDADKVATWAKDAMKFMVENGIVVDSGSMLYPDGKANRAHMAQALYNLLTK